MTAPHGVDIAVVSGDNPDAAGAQPAPEQQQAMAETPGRPARQRGPLLDEPDAGKVAKKVERLWSQQQKAMENRGRLWKACRFWRQGRRFVRVSRTASDEIRLYVPPQSAHEPPQTNKCDTLIRRIGATLLVDPPVAEAEPATGEQRDQSTAEFTTRVLRSLAGEHETNLLAKMAAAVDLSGTYFSGFLYACIDPYGGGQRPVTVLAAPNAVSVAEGQDPRIDPVSGQIAATFVECFVAEDGTLSDSAADARTQWLPKIRLEVLTGHHLRFLPETCTGIEDADAVILCIPTTLGQLRGRFESEDAPWSDELVKRIATYRPARHTDLLPAWMESASVDDQSAWEEGMPPAEWPCFPFYVYYRESAQYPDGAYLCTVGPKDVLYREDWAADVLQQDGTERREALPIPVAQVRQLDDHQDGDPYGTTLTLDLGPMDEIRAQVLSAQLEYMDRTLYAREYIPMGSNLTPEQLSVRDGRPVQYNAEAGVPVFEVPPQFPLEAHNLLQFITDEMNERSSLSETAQGLETDAARSGVAKQLVVEQSQIGLSQIKANVDRAFERINRILLALVRGFYTIPQRMGYVGEDGRFKEAEWTRADLGATRDIRLQRGSGTMLSPMRKMALAREELDIGAKYGDVEAYRRYQQTLRGALAPTLGLQDDPIRQRVMRQIHDWEDGPPEELADAEPMPTGQIDAMGQPVMTSPMGEAAARIFAPLPVDAEPLAAVLRHQELARAMSGSVFASQPPEWQQALVAEYERMRAAAGIVTVAEQQAAAQQQAMQAQQQQQQAAAMAQQQQATQQDAEAAQREQDRMVDLEEARIRAAARSQPAA